MKLAHALDDGLARFLIGRDAERRVFLDETAKGLATDFMADWRAPKGAAAAPNAAAALATASLPRRIAGSTTNISRSWI